MSNQEEYIVEAELVPMGKRLIEREFVPIQGFTDLSDELDDYQLGPQAKEGAIAMLQKFVANEHIITEALSDGKYLNAGLFLLQRLSYITGSEEPGEYDEQLDRFADYVAAELLNRNLGVIHNTLLNNEDPLLEAQAVRYVHFSLRENSDTETTDQRIPFLLAHFESAAKSGYLKSDWGASPESVFNNIIKNADMSQQSNALEVLGILLQDDHPEAVHTGVNLLAGAVTSSYLDQTLKDKLDTEVVSPMLANYGIDYEAASEAWSEASGELLDGAYKAANILAIHELEAVHAGICRVLSGDEYGFKIVNFARWPRIMLLEQYNLRDDKEIDYISLVAATKDNATIWGHEKPFEEFGKSLSLLEPPATVRVYEASHKLGIVRAWAKSGRRYGSMSGRVIVAHGTKEGMLFGPATDDETLSGSVLTKDDIEGITVSPSKGRRKKPSVLDKYSSPGCETIVISCNTGEDNGIIEAASKKRPNETITAPDVSVKLKSLTPTRRSDGTLHLEVEYIDVDNDGIHESNEAKRRFLGGKVISSTVSNN